jgi:hypothetical protein
MATTLKEHPFTLDCLEFTVRHKHPYEPPNGTTQRCTCGHRLWVVNLGGQMPAQAACAKCGNLSRTATAWLAGFDAGRHHKPGSPPP